MQKVKIGRQHYLRFEVPTTWQIWEDNNMKWDSTLTYPEKEGFRCGTCYEYSPFNNLDVNFRKPKANKSSNLIIKIKKLIPEYLKDIIKNRIIKKSDNLEILEVINNYFHDNRINDSNLYNLNAYLAKLNIWMLDKEK